MTSRTPTTIVTTDPVVRAGLLYALRPQPEVLLIDDDEEWSPIDGQSRVIVVAGESVDEAVLRLIRSNVRKPNHRVVVVVSSLDTTSVFVGLEAGASSFLRRADATSRELVRAITATASGEGTIPPEMLPDVLENLGRLQRQVLSPRGLSFAPLSVREIAVLRLLAEGCAVAEISQQLCYSERTIKSIVHDVTLRFGLRNRTHAVAYAVREGLI